MRAGRLVAMVGLLGACGDPAVTRVDGGDVVDVEVAIDVAPEVVVETDTGTARDTVDAPDAVDEPETFAGSEGRVLVTTTAITGRRGTWFRAVGSDRISARCIHVTSDPFVVTRASLTQLEGDPCRTPETFDIVAPPGPYKVTAGIYAQEDDPDPLALTDRTAIVDGDVTVTLDGAALSATP